MTTIRIWRKLAWAGCLLSLTSAWQPAFAGDDVFAVVGHEMKIDPLLLRAIAMQESDMNELAINCYGISYEPATIEEAMAILRQQGLKCDIGLMQINYGYNGERMGVSVHQLFDQETNVRIAARILRENMNGTDNAWVAVGRYHNWKDKKRSSYYAHLVYRHYMAIRRN